MINPIFKTISCIEETQIVVFAGYNILLGGLISRSPNGKVLSSSVPPSNCDHPVSHVAQAHVRGLPSAVVRDNYVTGQNLQINGKGNEFSIAPRILGSEYTQVE